MKQFDKLVNYINETVDRRENEMDSVTKKIQDPVLAGFLIGKLSSARESGADLAVECSNKLPQPANDETTHELITIIGNLIENALEAISHTSSKKVNLAFDYADDILTIEVRDTGIGMNKEIQNRITEKGFSTKGENRGYGLYLVTQAVDKLEGDLIISSKPGKGTNFAVYIPYKAKGGEV
jgi:CitB family two-component system sensor histidine kinase MalK